MSRSRRQATAPAAAAGHAIVIGGGIGGLLSACALARRYPSVTLLERYRYPTLLPSGAPAARSGVPQSRCLHLLTAAGAAAFDTLVPGWRDDLCGLGATAFDASADTRIRLAGGWLPRAHSGIVTYACSRALIEETLRRRVTALQHVRLVEGASVLGLEANENNGDISGVRIALPTGTDLLPGDMIVDASGALSPLPRWLAALRGRSNLTIPVTKVDLGMQYVSRWYHIPPYRAPDWHCLTIAAAADRQHRCAMMARAENAMWAVVLMAPAGTPLPVDDDSVDHFIADLGDGALRAALATAEPASPLHRYRDTPNRLLHLDWLRDRPGGIIALGDAVCMLDPFFGLGMTNAARGAALLAACLDEADVAALDCFRFQRRLSRLNTRPWLMATGLDTGGQADDGYLTRIGALCDIAPLSVEAAHALLAEQHLLHAPESHMEVVGS